MQNDSLPPHVIFHYAQDLCLFRVDMRTGYINSTVGVAAEGGTKILTIFQFNYKIKVIISQTDSDA